MKKILVTGSEGFIGSQLIKHLSLFEYEIETLNEDYFYTENWLITLNNFLDKKDFDVIFHIGACSNTLETDVDYMMTRNYESTKVLMEHAKLKNIPFIYSSSAANYGINGNYPSNLYGWSKYIAEDYVLLNGGVALRYFNVYGPGEHNKGGMASVAYQMYIKNKESEKIKLFPKKPKRDFVYVKDVVSANLYAWKHYGKLKGDYYDVGYGEAMPFEDVLDLMGIKYEYHDESIIPNGYQFYTCSDKNKWMYGWEPKWNLASGINDYKNNLN
jgi:ADP-L-glycero-D-manno-heptose 6-epimerase